ncbi:hypothetical protein D081_1485 [Anaerovibrio sp. JC8]|uniref:hypothetical protein n=1 Tax=Anaerovibrio sp. JC8 TaxID=1240085 RepID=UPI000A0C97B8|nr:hypothetical protein [Anaerovibrio sp. JC8]ORT99904.1 hypothetical protein D081_1485 [Anaerovibrio sp. JC8]
MAFIDNSMEILMQLHNLANNSRIGSVSKSPKSKSTDETSDTKSFADVWSKIQKEQQEFDAILDQVDLAQYKLSLQDAFWSSQADAMKYLRNYTQRHQRAYTQEALGTITTGVLKLHQLNSLYSYNMDPEITQNLSKQLQTALTEAMMANIKSTGSWLSY